MNQVPVISLKKYITNMLSDSDVKFLHMVRNYKFAREIYHVFMDDFTYDQWFLISKFQQLNYEDVICIEPYVNWDMICQNNVAVFCDKFWNRYKGKITNWEKACINLSVPEFIIREKEDEISRTESWVYISTYGNLSDQFMIDFKDKLHWGLVIRNQKQPISDSVRKSAENYINGAWG